MKSTEYHCFDQCNKCGGKNNIQTKDIINGIICECETQCEKCGHFDYWAHGFFASAQEGYDECKKYYN